MKVFKEASAAGEQKLTDGDLSLINVYAKRELKEDEVFTFSVLLCDNEVDRDWECFSGECLKELKDLFLGKTGITDHEWSASRQIARIYKTEGVTDRGRHTSYGEIYTYLKGWAYMLKSEENREIINQINGGIKKEVSVGCSVKKRTCSICGGEIYGGACPHVPGCEYDGNMCRAVLSEPSDAYEWSFVAVPAQRDAGVMKKANFSEHKDTGEIFRAYPELKKEYESLKKYSDLGKRYLDGLYNDAVRLGVLSDMGFEEEFLKKMLRGRSEEELLKFKQIFEKKIDEKYPLTFQLHSRGKETPKFSGEEFLI